MRVQPVLWQCATCVCRVWCYLACCCRSVGCLSCLLACVALRAYARVCVSPVPRRPPYERTHRHTGCCCCAAPGASAQGVVTGRGHVTSLVGWRCVGLCAGTRPRPRPHHRRGSGVAGAVVGKCCSELCWQFSCVALSFALRAAPSPPDVGSVCTCTHKVLPLFAKKELSRACVSTGCRRPAGISSVVGGALDG
jgi:hypothetical protein